MSWGRNRPPGGTSEEDLDAIIGSADAARDARDWELAAERYARVVARDIGDAGMWVQFGHALKETGQIDRAEAAYLRALAIDRGNPDTHLQLGHALKLQGHRERAIAAYAQAVRIAPDFAPAVNELVQMGARAAIPAASGRDWARGAAIADALARAQADLRDWQAGAGYPLAAWSRFARDLPTRPPPGPLPRPALGALVIVVDCLVAAPAFLRSTLRSLQDQSVTEWRAIVTGPAALGNHPVASFAATDARIVFAHVEAMSDLLPENARHVLSLSAGTVLHAESLAWLLFAADRTDAAAISCDHDRGVEHFARGLDRAEPVLSGAFDRDLMRAPLPVVLVRASLAHAALDRTAGDFRAAVIAAIGNDDRVAHVPRVLATILDLALGAEQGRATSDDAIAGRLAPADPPRTPRPTGTADTRIAIVIPTRDHANMLARAIDSLKATARNPDRLSFVIVDNRSCEDATRTFLAGLDARIVPMDEAFNWSRACNLGAAACDADILLFANNDIEMLSAGWDDALAVALARGDVGAVGARLLYPDLTVQHAGIVFGLGDGSPQHEGRHAPFDATGPADRFVTAHAAAAVTGAFLGVTRVVFDDVCGFDADRLFVGHSDIDLCLQIRETGRIILYQPAIEALHHEGHTRGRNETKADIAWDLGEYADLVARWGGALVVDPGISPYWAPGGQPFDGLREPAKSAIVHHIDLTARARPWVPTRRQAELAAEWDRPIIRNSP